MADRKFIKDYILVIALIIIGGILISILSYVVKVDSPPAYVTNVQTHPCVVPIIQSPE